MGKAGKSITAAVVNPLIASGGLLGLPIIEAKKARKKAEAEARRQAAEQDAKLREGEKKQLDSDLERNTAGVTARKRSISNAGPRRRGTILTSPIGLSDEPEIANKSLLGR